MIRLSEALTWVDYNAIFSDRWEWNDFIVRLHIIIKKDFYTHFSRTKFFGPDLSFSSQDGAGQQDRPVLIIICDAQYVDIQSDCFLWKTDFISDIVMTCISLRCSHKRNDSLLCDMYHREIFTCSPFSVLYMEDSSKFNFPILPLC